MRGQLRRGAAWVIAQLREPRPDPWHECREYVSVGPRTLLAPSSAVNVMYRPDHAGVCIEIGADTQVFGSLTVLRPGARIAVGDRTQIGSSNIIAACGISIGDDVLIAWGVTLLDNDSHSLHWTGRKNDVLQCGRDYFQTPENYIRNKDWSSVRMRPIRIGNKAWIGFGASILKGVTIGEGAVVGAGSLVTRDVPPYTLVAGNPAREIRPITDEDNRQQDA